MEILEPINYEYSIPYEDLQSWIIKIIINTSVKNPKLKENNSFIIDKELTLKIKNIIDSIYTKNDRYPKSPKRVCIFYQNYRLENYIRKNNDFWSELSQICKKRNIVLNAKQVDFQKDSNNKIDTHLSLCKGNLSFRDSLTGDLYADEKYIFEIKNNYYNLKLNLDSITRYFQNNKNYTKFLIQYKITTNGSSILNVYNSLESVKEDNPFFAYELKDFSYNFLPRNEIISSNLMKNLPQSWRGIWLSEFNNDLTWDNILNWGENNNNMNEDIRDLYKNKYNDLEFELHSDFSNKLIYTTKKGIIDKTDPIVMKVGIKNRDLPTFGTLSELVAENTKREIHKGDEDFNDCLERYKNEYQIPNYDRESYENIDILLELVNKDNEIFYIPKDYMNPNYGIEAAFDICEFLDDYIEADEDDIYEFAEKKYDDDFEFGDDSKHDDYIIEDLSDDIDKKHIWYRVIDTKNNLEKTCNTIEEACEFAEKELNEWYIERIVDNGEDIEIREAWSSDNPLNREDIIEKENIIKNNLKEVE